MSEKKTLNVLVTGGSGLLGRAVLKCFTLNDVNSIFNWNVIGLYHSRPRDGLTKLDLTNYNDVILFIHEFKVSLLRILEIY